MTRKRRSLACHLQDALTDSGRNPEVRLGFKLVEHWKHGVDQPGRIGLKQNRSVGNNNHAGKSVLRDARSSSSMGSVQVSIPRSPSARWNSKKSTPAISVAATRPIRPRAYSAQASSSWISSAVIGAPSMVSGRVTVMVGNIADFTMNSQIVRVRRVKLKAWGVGSPIQNGMVGRRSHGALIKAPTKRQLAPRRVVRTGSNLKWARQEPRPANLNV